MSKTDAEIGKGVKVVLSAVQKWMLTFTLTAAGAYLTFIARKVVTAFETLDATQAAVIRVDKRQVEKDAITQQIMRQQAIISKNQTMLYCEMQRHHGGEECRAEFIPPKN